jgi:hypothetical protein
MAMFWFGLFWFVAGAYTLGLVFTAYATSDEPMPDRAFIALCWPIAVIWNLFFD